MHNVDKKRTRLAARESNAETGLYYYRARYYDPAAGRFLSEDPIGFAGGVNAYRYVGNLPTRFVDPFGLFGIDERIPLTRAISVDFACPSNNAGACTINLSARIECNCNCDGSGIRAQATLIVRGRMYVNSGPWPYKNRWPVDPSVVDEASAISHERNVHINSSIDGVKPSLNRLEAQVFKSEKECKNECKKISDFVGSLFGAILNSTQIAESNHR
jgi:RHS repeat-associated protein